MTGSDIYHRANIAVILGLNAFHGDSSACLIKDGKLIAAAVSAAIRMDKKEQA